MFDKLREPALGLIPFSGTKSFDIVLLDGGTISGVGGFATILPG